MKKGYLILALAVILMTAAIAFAILQIENGTASQSQTDTNGSLESTLYVDAVTDTGDVLTIPKVTYSLSSDKESYVLGSITQSVRGTLTVHASKATSLAVLRMGVDFEKQGSWMLIDTIAFTIIMDNASTTYSVYDSTSSVIAGKPTEAMNVLKNGVYDFTLTVKYKSQIKNDPTPYHGDNMISKVQFLVRELDPLNGLLVELNSNDEQNKVEYQTIYQQTTALNQPFVNRGHTFSSWNSKSDGTGTTYDLDSLKANIPTVPQESPLKLYACWATNHLTVSYNDLQSGSYTDQTIIGYPDGPNYSDPSKDEYKGTHVYSPKTAEEGGKPFHHWRSNTDEIFYPGHDLREDNSSVSKSLALTAVYMSKANITGGTISGASITGYSVSGPTGSSSGSSLTDAKAFEGDAVTLTFTPQSNHFLKTISISYNDGSAKTIDEIHWKSDNVCSFTAVGYDMTVNATFETKYTVTPDGTMSGARLSHIGTVFAGERVHFSLTPIANKCIDSDISIKYNSTSMNADPDYNTIMIDYTVTDTVQTPSLTIKSDSFVSEEIEGSWKKWNTGVAGNYTVASGDAKEGFIVLVKDGYTLGGDYHVITIDQDGNISIEECAINTIIDGKWKVWNTGKARSYTVASGDAKEGFIVLVDELYKGALDQHTFIAQPYNMTVYATIKSLYTVTYNGNGNTSGNVPVDNNSPYKEGTNVTVLGNTQELAKQGYVFVNWNTEPNGSGNNYAANDTIENIDRNIILYAVWGHIVTINNGNHGNVTARDKASESPIISGSSVRDGLTVVFTYVSNDGYHPAGFTMINVGEYQKEVTITSDYTLEPVESNLYTVVWKSQDGSETYETDSNVEYGSAPSYDGSGPSKADDESYTYAFAGWATDANQESGTAVGSLPSVDGNTTYYAAFSKASIPSQ
jgi:hypothetical protein